MTNKQMNNTLGGITNRITETEEQISDLGERWRLLPQNRI